MSTEFEWSEEQRTLRGVVTDFCRRRTASTGDQAGFDRDTWTQLAAGLSVAGLTVDEELGGAGASLLEAGIVAEELGRTLLRTPLVPTVGLAVTALAHCGQDSDARDALTRIAAGEAVATAALADEQGILDPSKPPLAAREEDGVWYVDGVSGYVLEGGRADLVLVHATGGGAEPMLLLVDAGASGLTRDEVVALDHGRTQARLAFDGVPATRLVADRPVAEVVRAAVDAAATLLALEQTGIAQAMLDLSVAHASTRMQFGRAIGSFQAVKHRIADMYVEVEHARSAAYHALWALVHGADDPALASSLAFATASEAARKVTRGTVQVHGGIGFTWEHAAHRYLKAAQANSTLLGGDRLHSRRLAELVLAKGAEVGA
ncbi:acyl-CoA dehydrogenase family protein [Nocardioides campestrisoli]|uniref:acyl-CoA dehydrogenase family protein n=1 Tax=Nocardioides campestrisoli TaxID=2736757 RepID=UPI00163D7E89|nr:acyl-CoA dehydrogenase family protein [Nocardioides campestrisoli]